MTAAPHPGSAVVCALGGLPTGALPVLRNASAVYADGLSIVDTPRAPAAEALLAEAADRAVVLVCADRDAPAAKAMLAAGAPLHGPVPGTELCRAVAVMDRLRSPGGCPWDAEQSHESLRRYLVEETYELLEAIEDGDRAALREELGDVLLQVLFHARVATEHERDPFGVDEVAAELVAKLVSRHPHVFADDPAVTDARTQEERWQQLKQAEKRRESSVDGVALGQPAAALAGKLVARAMRAGMPTSLLPAGDPFAAVAERAARGHDPEGELRDAARDFAARVRAAEAAARADGAALDEHTWPRYWAVAHR